MDGTAYVNLCAILTTVYLYSSIHIHVKLSSTILISPFWKKRHPFFLRTTTWVFWMHHLSCKAVTQCIAFFSSSAWSALYSSSMILSSSCKAIRTLRGWNYLSQLVRDFLSISRLSIKSHAIVPDVQLQPPSLFLWVLRFQCPERINTTQQNTPRGGNWNQFRYLSSNFEPKSLNVLPTFFTKNVAFACLSRTFSFSSLGNSDSPQFRWWRSKKILGQGASV